MWTQNKDKHLTFKTIGVVVGAVICIGFVSRCSYIAGQNAGNLERVGVEQKATSKDQTPTAKQNTEKQDVNPVKPVIQSVMFNENKPTQPPTPPKSNWEWHYDVDAMTSNAQNFAFNYSTNKLSFGSPYQGQQQGSIVIRYQSDEGDRVMIGIEKGQILCHESFRSCKIKVRFDQNAPEEFDASGASDSSSEVIFIVDAKTFVEKLEKSEKLLVQLTVFHEGSPVLEFDTRGFSSDRLKGKK